MKLLRCGNKGSEKPAALDKNGKIRDLSSHISDLNTKNIFLDFHLLAANTSIQLYLKKDYFYSGLQIDLYPLD